MRRRAGTERNQRAIMQIARDTCYVHGDGAVLVIEWSYGEIRRGWKRTEYRGTDPMSVAVLKIERPRGSKGNKTGETTGRGGRRGTSVVLLRIYGSVSPLTDIAAVRKYPIVSRRVAKMRHDTMRA